MHINKKESRYEAGKIVGYLLGFFIFTTVLYFILRYTGKLPLEWGYYHVTGITSMVAVVGAVVRRYLK